MQLRSEEMKLVLCLALEFRRTVVLLNFNLEIDESLQFDKISLRLADDCSLFFSFFSFDLFSPTS